MRASIQNLIKNSIFIECTLPNTEHSICKTKYTTAEDFCLTKNSDESIAQITYNNIIPWTYPYITTYKYICIFKTFPT